jgi:hypothetical protein
MKMARKQQIAWCYVVVTGGRLPEHLGELLDGIRELIPNITETICGRR